MPLQTLLLPLLYYVLLTTTSAFKCDPDGCSAHGCCTKEDECATDAAQCYRKSCDRWCESKCCTGSECQPTNASCRRQNTLVLILIGLAVLLCIILIVLSYYRRNRLRRRREAARRAARAQQRGPQQQQPQAQAQAQAPGVLSNLLDYFPRLAGYSQQPDYTVDKGKPFREGGMQKAYELENVASVGYGQSAPAVRVEEQAHTAGVGSVHMSQNNVDQKEDVKDVDDDNDDEKISIGGMLKSNYEDSD